MIKIKQIVDFNKDFYYRFFEFCINSKPYSFCSLNSISLRNMKIKEYFDFLLKECIVVDTLFNDEWIRSSFFYLENNELTLQFMIGDCKKYSPKFVINSVHETLLFTMKKFDKNQITSIITRRHKRNNFINWIKRYDKICEIDQSTGTTEIIWKYERFN